VGLGGEGRRWHEDGGVTVTSGACRNCRDCWLEKPCSGDLRRAATTGGEGLFVVGDGGSRVGAEGSSGLASTSPVHLGGLRLIDIVFLFRIG
jgi:hypothetical protein